MNNVRQIVKILPSRATQDGAGVRLDRVFSNQEAVETDPFLLLDFFHSDNPKDYIAGFPWHPHRGIETVTYMLHGKVRHEDSIGNNGVIGPGDIQWMTAGSGIIHQEMPEQEDGILAGFQLWVNLPAKSKMINPRYQEYPGTDIPEYKLSNGPILKIICGRLNGLTGPVKDITADAEYLDIYIPSGSKFDHKVKPGYTVIAFIYWGEARFCDEDQVVGKDHLVLYGDGEKITVSTLGSDVRFLLISGKPFKEPIAWWGPIVMNSDEELKTAIDEYQKGTFIKK